LTEPLNAEELERPRYGTAGPVRVRVPAKINLHLGVGPLRADGFHELTTIYHAISLYDEVSARRGDQLTLTMEGEGAGQLPLDDSNLVIRAAQVLAKVAGVPAHARLHLRKQIPVAGGLAGGSADAAAALVACDALWGTNMSRDELAGIAAEVGSDVPFLVLGGTALGTGRGERLTPVLAAGRWHWVLAVAGEGLSTPDVYGELDRLRTSTEQPVAGAPDRLINALRVHDAGALGQLLANDLQAPALALRPELRRTLRVGVDLGAIGAVVSGSGPTCAFLSRSREAAVRLAAALAGAGVCRTVRIAYGPVPGARVVADEEGTL